VPVLGVTGGVAVGKTTLSMLLGAELGADRFSADDEVRRLLGEDAGVASAIAAALGPGVMGADGRPDRPRLRDRVFDDGPARQALEAVLHPRVRRAWEQKIPYFRVADRFLVVEIPLLYETGGADLCDAVIVAACSRVTQLERMARDRHLDPVIARKIIAAQMDLEEKARLADHVVWNDGSKRALEREGRLLAGMLRVRWAA
jgi:dephospho-CoA kinase